MPWYEPCASLGYTKFLTNPQLREDRWIVSDTYLQSLLQAYRQAYVNANGPDYEDSDDLLLDQLASNCISSTSAAANLGQSRAAADIGAGQDYHQQSLAPGGAIPSTPPTGQPTATVYTTGSPTPVGQPDIYYGSGGGTASPSTSGPPGAFGYGVTPAGAPVPEMMAQQRIPWLLILAAAAGAYLLMRKR